MDFKSSRTPSIGKIKQSNTLTIQEITLRTNFQNWFGKSKIVDRNGLPLEVYHGGTKFDAFRSSPSAMAHFASDDYAIADGYADQYPREHVELKALFLKIENPLDLRDPKIYLRWTGVDPLGSDAASEWGRRTFMAQNCIQARSGGGILAAAKRAGHDGVIFFDTDVRNRGYHTTYAFFEPTQAKIAPGGDARLNHYGVREVPHDLSFDPLDQRIDR